MSFRSALLLALCLGTGTACSSPATDTAEESPPPTRHLAPFSDEQAFERLLAGWEQQARERYNAGARKRSEISSPPPLVEMVAEEAAPALTAVADAGAEAEEPITNVQTAGVDEGGIVKRHGDHLVVLRRGRLFTVRIGDDRLQPVSTVDAFGPETDPRGAWYDEMLIGDHTVVVIGYSYARGGTELVLFDIGRDGTLGYRDTYHLRSNDYYSSRNYASRLIGDTLVFYTPMQISPWNLARRDFLPGMRRWHPGATPEEFKRILPATRIYRTDEDIDPFDGGVALHTVTRCDLTAPALDCTSSAVLGRPGRVFYVSTNSVFVWTTHYDRQASSQNSAVFRIPLDDDAPSALKTRGVPIDQLSFLHDGDNHLNVLLSEVGAGEGMWGNETSSGTLALLHVPLDSFGDGSTAAPASAYRRLPGEANGAMQNRFVGDWLLYGSAPHRWQSDEDANIEAPAHAVRYAARQPVQELALDHGTERIEAMGRNAIVVGSAGNDLHFTSVQLDDRRAKTRHTYVQADAAQGESRTHGFFYRSESDRQGIVGLPIIGQRRDNNMQRYLGESASVLYLRNRDLRLTRMGELVADADSASNDHCKASCVDWYGNARPIFIGERVFALLGYELVEGRVSDERIVERRRVNFAPGVAISE